MNKKSHNKKRNVGIIYEQLILTMSKGIVENNPIILEQAKNIIKSYFKPGTELYKEHKLFQALIKPEINDASLATAILGEAKKASRAHDFSRLEREKSKMIRDINLSFGKSFYKTKIKEYKDFATVQTLINDWRFESKDFERLVEYENKAHSILIRKKTSINLNEQKVPEINNLVVKIMTEKFNNRYQKRLTDVQKSLIKQYVFIDVSPDFKTTLESIKESCTASLKEYHDTCDSSLVKAKIAPVLKELNEIDTEKIDDEKFSRFMTICQLQSELQGKING
tara:strand:+ start:10130 stop:10972 length:843 start_codon:yes stop_codon:yes gene_type:complete